MHTGTGRVTELILEDDDRYLRISCPPNLIPSPGQYLLASDGADTLLPVPLFHTDSAPGGFIAAASAPVSWTPGSTLHLRGPLGRGFALPLPARKVALIALDRSPARLKGLIGPALKQEAAVVLVCTFNPQDWPDEVEVQPVSTLPEILGWADYAAFDIPQEKLHELGDVVGKVNQHPAARVGQVLIHTSLPCGGVADCGVCAVRLRSDWKLACKEGPVFDWNELP
ncbi:MAG: hypothetical protein M3Y68_07510 [Chloroflexota bacterium]|nr:hypothetical protein [Chloroflexota bacterium]